MNTVVRRNSHPKWIRALTAALLTAVLAACGTTTPPVDTDNDVDPAAPTGVITGTLTTSSGAPASNMQLSISNITSPVDADTLEAMSVTTTDQDGQFAFNVADAGTYGITGITDDEGVYIRVNVSRNADGSLTSDPVTSSTAPLGAVTGQVNEKRAGVMVSLLGTSFLALTDNDGAFSITRVPAGTYSIAASVAGRTGASKNITVKSGEATELTEALAFGPTITGVTPAGIQKEPESGELPEYVLTGSGFGDSIGTSRLFYAGRDMSYVVTQWSDTRITISSDGYLDYWVSYDGLDTFRFSVATTSGEAHSTPAGTLSANLWLANEGDNAYHLSHAGLYSSYFPGITFDLSTNHGTLHTDTADGPVVNTYTSELEDESPLVAVPSDTAAQPMVTTVSFEGLELSRHITGNYGSVELLNDNRMNTPGEPYQARLRLHGEHGNYKDDGKFTYTVEVGQYSRCPDFHSEPQALRLNSTGEAIITVPAFDRIQGDHYCHVNISVQYDGVHVDSTWIDLANDYEITGISITSDSPHFNNGTLTLTAGDTAYLEVLVHYANAPSADIGYTTSWNIDDPNVGIMYSLPGYLHTYENYEEEPRVTTLSAEHYGFTDEITLIVNPIGITSINIESYYYGLSDGSITLESNDEASGFFLWVSYENGAALDVWDDIHWTIEDPSIASIDEDGYLITGSNPEDSPISTTLTASYRGFSDSLTIFVNPDPAFQITGFGFTSDTYGDLGGWIELANGELTDLQLYVEYGDYSISSLSWSETTWNIDDPSVAELLPESNELLAVSHDDTEYRYTYLRVEYEGFIEDLSIGVAP